MTNKHILLLEDDLELTRLLSSFLKRHYTVTTCSQAGQARSWLQRQTFDLLLCDVNLPGKSGFDLVKEIRQQFSGPILFMTARTDVASQLTGFELGAQDYLLKPIEPEVLLAKLKVFLSMNSEAQATQDEWVKYNLVLNTANKTATLSGQRLDLTSAEYMLLEALLNRFGSVVSRESLFQMHLSREYDGIDRTMDGRASRLRKKLQSVDTDWTVSRQWGEGYYLEYKGSGHS